MGLGQINHEDIENTSSLFVIDLKGTFTRLLPTTVPQIMSPAVGYTNILNFIL